MLNLEPGHPSYTTDPEVAAAIADVLEPPKDAKACWCCRFYSGNGECRRHAPPWPTVSESCWCGDFVRKS